MLGWTLEPSKPKSDILSVTPMDRYTVETPENIEVEYELAGLGSRFCAMVIDFIYLFLATIGLIVLMLILGMSLFTAFDQFARDTYQWMFAAVIAIMAVLFYGGYFTVFELFWRGQTPGKKALKIRVIRDDGTPATANEILVRNILRLVDFLPFGYALGAIVMFPSSMSKRLGDLAAGTIVVKEGQVDYRAEADKKNRQLPAQIVEMPNAELTPEERRVLAGFLHRRIELLPAARQALAERLARPLHEKYGGHYHSAERYIERLVEGSHHEP